MLNITKFQVVTRTDIVLIIIGIIGIIIIIIIIRYP